MRYLLLTLISLLPLFPSFAQYDREAGIGIEGIYNLPIKGIGVGVRYQQHLGYTFVLTPKIDYYLPFNKVHELLIGLDVQARIQFWRDWGPYVLVGPYYDHWFNYTESSLSTAKASNFTAEAGLGFGKNFSCVRPFAEYRVNSKWFESNVRIGVAFYFQDCGPPNLCPTYNGSKRKH